MVEMECEKCGSLYELTEDEFEEREEHKTNDLCPVCFDDLILKSTEKPVKRYFEYMIAPMESKCELKAEQIGFALYGQDGWDLVGIYNEKAYFKREYFKEVSDVN